MSVIVFAPPQASLPAQAREVATLVNNFDHPLLAQTEDDLQRCIEVANDAIVGLWFVGHSSAAGLAVGGQTMTPATLGQYLSTAGVEWSFYNSCESAMFIEQVQKSHDHDCYANITEVNDTSAWRTAALVAAKYADVGDIHRAVRLAAPPGSTPLRFFPSGNMSRGNMSQRDVEQAAELSRKISELTQVLTGNSLFKEPGLIESVRSLQTRQSFLMEEITELRWWARANTLGLLLVGIIEIWARFWR